jgi:hypothetical protein
MDMGELLAITVAHDEAGVKLHQQSLDTSTPAGSAMMFSDAWCILGI